MLCTHTFEGIINQKIVKKESIGGGDISEVWKLTTSEGESFLLKTSDNNNQDMYKAESEGLNELANSNSFRIPKVFFYGSDYLITEYIKQGRAGFNFNMIFAKKLFDLHASTTSIHGFRIDNYIGSNVQVNSVNYSWKEFYWENRILYQIKLAEKNKMVTKELVSKISKLESKIDIILGHKPKPSLLHGDLWNGNYIVDESGNPVLIDPAVYYGDRETDLAMMKLFGGFSNSIFEEYTFIESLPHGWKDRENIYKLYHLLNHMNLFGSIYYHKVIESISYYC